jgi:hypothetical protein
MHAVIQRRGPAQDLRATIDRLPLHVRRAVLDGIKSQRIIAGAHADATGGVCPMVAADVPWKSVSPTSVQCAQEAARAWDRYADAHGSSRTATKRQLLALSSMLEASILQESTETDTPLCDAIAEYRRARSRWGSGDVPLARPSSLDVPAPGTRYLGLADAIEVPAERRDSLEVAAERRSPVDVPAPERPIPREVPTRPSLRKRRDTGERDRTTELRDQDGWAWLRPFRSYDEYEETLLRALEELDTHERRLEELRVR